MDNLIRSLKKIGTLERQEVILKSKKISDFYIDIKKAYGFPHILNEMAEQFYNILPKRANCIAASDYGGLPLAAVISSRHSLRLILMRKKKKSYGLNKLIEGYVPNFKDNVAIIDDVATTGTSLKMMVKVLEPTKANILGCYVIVKRGELDLKCPLYWLFEARDFFQKEKI